MSSVRPTAREQVRAKERDIATNDDPIEYDSSTKSMVASTTEGLVMSENAIPRRLPWVMLSFHVLAILLLFSLLVFVVPKCEATLQDFQAELPAITQWIVVCSREAVVYWYLMLPIVLVGDASVLFAFNRLPATLTWPATVWSVFVLLAVGLMILVTVVAVGMPMMNLVKSLN